MPMPKPLSAADHAAVHDLADAANSADGVRPLSERTLLDLDLLHESVRHLLVWQGGELAAYAQLGRERQGELVVHPAHRRAGHGRNLLTNLAGQGAAAVWAHGDLPAARALAASVGWEPVRILRKLSRPLAEEDSAPVTLPEGHAIRGFVPGQDEADWLRINALAFADHPEQGRVTRNDLDRLIAQDWFDPAGLLLLTDASGAVIGSHWTKVDPAERAPAADGSPVPAGEVYVVALDPAVHGRGLAGPLTAAGLAHLAARGLRSVVLYVDDDNTAALRTYRRLGFTDLEVHAQYAPVSAARPA
ncbi:MAG: mycothiol synthase [Actinobacteria bacterium]|nr:mycothiol synthase [Actinomycetota bacterium]